MDTYENDDSFVDELRRLVARLADAIRMVGQNLPL
jgi:hypothetical protein